MEKSLPFPSIVIQLAGEGRLVSRSQTATFLLCGGGKVDYFSRPSLMVAQQLHSTLRVSSACKNNYHTIKVIGNFLKAVVITGLLELFHKS